MGACQGRAGSPGLGVGFDEPGQSLLRGSGLLMGAGLSEGLGLSSGTMVKVLSGTGLSLGAGVGKWAGLSSGGGTSLARFNPRYTKRQTVEAGLVGAA